jgi:hypothetical protein
VIASRLPTECVDGGEGESRADQSWQARICLSLPRH